jgi:2-hydroxyacyl-CoA lyase 1
MVGKPGCTYIELPGDILRMKVPENLIAFPESFQIDRIPKCLCPLSDIQKAINLIKSAKSPLVIIGKGAAYSRAEREIRQFISSS